MSKSCLPRSRYKPSAILTFATNDDGDITSIKNDSNWEDGCCSTGRESNFIFSINDVVVHATGFQAIETPFTEISPNSTYTELVSDTLLQDIVDYLATLGITCETGDVLKVRLEVKNCKGRIDIGSRCSTSGQYLNEVTVTKDICHVDSIYIGGEGDNCGELDCLVTEGGDPIIFGEIFDDLHVNGGGNEDEGNDSV